MGIIVSVIYFIIYACTGYLLSRRVFFRERTVVRLWLGGVFSLLLLLWLPALFSFLLGFTAAAQYIALLVCAAIGASALFLGKKQVLSKTPWKAELPLLCTLLPLFILGTVLFCTHTLMPVDGALYSGQSTFGDLPLHLGFVTSLARQGTFPPMYSICPGVAVGYPFLCDSISATFYVLGATLRFSMLLPAVFAYGLVLLGVYLFFERWLKTPGKAVFSTLLFFIGGGFGFAYFFDLLQQDPENLTRIFTAFYETPTNYTAMGVRWVNPIADMLIPQRATLFGWALLFPCLYLLRRAAYEKEKAAFLALGIIAGCMPLVHTHSFLALGVISAIYLFQALASKEGRNQWKLWLTYAGVALLLSAPQLLCFTFRQAESFLTLRFNWANESDSFLWFYIKNWGLLFLLLPVAVLRFPKAERRYLYGAFALWLLAECIQFQPNPYDNNKLLFVVFAYICGAVGSLLTDAFTAYRGKVGCRYLAAVTCALLFLSGILTLGREVVGKYEQFSSEAVEAAGYIEADTDPRAVFLTATNHNNAVAALTGRNIVCGTSSYLYFHGVDYSAREEHVRSMYERPDACFDQLRTQYGISYVLFSDYERYTYACDESYYLSRFPVAFENDGVCIYDVRA